MREVRFTEEQMVAIMREADREPVAVVAKRHGISEQTIYVWRKRFGGLQSNDVRRGRGSHPIGRPLNGETPTIDLVVGYHKLKHPQFLRTFLSKMARTNEQAKANSYLW